MEKYNLFYIGDDFYRESKTIMSPIYEKKTYKRWDWGFVSIALERGAKINITPATKNEMVWANAKLKAIKKEHAQVRNRHI